jgi:HAD superfamily phosphoserine phosphatase-like hydrolase
MATVIFDLDSTLFNCETLEKILIGKADIQTQNRIQQITEQGMSGEIKFVDSLKQRLALVKLSQADLLPTIQNAAVYMTEGMQELVDELQEEGIDVWIVSGTLRDIVIAAGRVLNIPQEKCLGIDLQWDQGGHYSGLDESVPINRSKWEEAHNVAARWSHPVISIGDGMTDYALLEHGLVNHFIAYTEHKRRQLLLDKGVPEARNVHELKQWLGDLLNGKT